MERHGGGASVLCHNLVDLPRAGVVVTRGEVAQAVGSRPPGPQLLLGLKP